MWPAANQRAHSNNACGRLGKEMSDWWGNQACMVFACSAVMQRGHGFTQACEMHLRTLCGGGICEAADISGGRQRVDHRLGNAARDRAHRLASACSSCFTRKQQDRAFKMQCLIRHGRHRMQDLATAQQGLLQHGSAPVVPVVMN